MTTSAAPLDAEVALPMALLMQHLKDPVEEDLVVETARLGALDWIERHVRQSLTRRARTATWSDGPGLSSPMLRLPMGPVAAVTSVTYQIAADEVVWPMGAWFVDGDDIVSATGSTWRGVFGRSRLSIRYEAGYEDLGTEAPALRTAALLLAGHFFRNREENAAATLASIPFGVSMLCEPLREPVIG